MMLFGASIIFIVSSALALLGILPPDNQMTPNEAFLWSAFFIGLMGLIIWFTILASHKDARLALCRAKEEKKP